MSEQKADYWDETGQIFFTGGHGYGITPELVNICLGVESEILAYLNGGSVPDNISESAVEELNRVKELKGEKQNERTAEIKRPSNIRSKPARTFKRRAASLRQPKTRKKLPVH